MDDVLPAPGFTVWLTGLPGSGKTTLGTMLTEELRAIGLRAELLDGDEVRETLSKGLGFSRDDRDEHIRRVAFVAELLARNGVAVIVAAISPYRATRDEVRHRLGGFVEVYVRCATAELERRDPKGLYARAKRGEIANFTGISAPYEAPTSPEVLVDTDRMSVKEAVALILSDLERRGHLPPRGVAS